MDEYPCSGTGRCSSLRCRCRAATRKPSTSACATTWSPLFIAGLDYLGSVRGYAYYGKPISPSGRKHHERSYAYYRCIGTDAYRFGGVRICSNKQLRTDLVDEAVWEEVCRLLSHPERLEQEYRRRLLQEEQTPDELSHLEARMSRLRQGIARLIDSYAEGLIDKDEFEPRIARMRERLKQIEEQAQQVKDEASGDARTHAHSGAS